MPPGPMNLSQTRIVDPVLSHLAQAFEPEERIYPKLFPRVEVPQRAGQIKRFDAAAFTKIDTRRAPGTRRARATPGYGSKGYVCIQHALDGEVAREDMEEAAAVPGIDLQMLALDDVMDVVSLNIEREAATLATTIANYPSDHHEALSGNDRWDNDNSAPNKKIEEACQKIREGVGKKPNVLILGPRVFSALKTHESVLDQITPTEGLRDTKKTLVNEMKLAAYFDVGEVVVGFSMAGEPGSFEDVWGKNAILAYTRFSAQPNKGRQSFGYCLHIRGYPMVEPVWHDRSRDTYVIPVTTEDTCQIVSNASGYLLTDVVD